MTYFRSNAEFRIAIVLARKFYAEAKEERAQEEREAAEQGFRPHYCIHGTNQWTDYDNICYGCEEGVTLLKMAVSRAAARITEGHRRCDIMLPMMGLSRVDMDALGIDGEFLKRAVEWALEPTKAN